MPSPIFCLYCGNNDKDSLSYQDDNEYTYYKCDVCNNIIDKTSLDTLRDIRVYHK